ncbi:hypothetical protein B4144_0473 [Bacillus atrophaeus]|nr:hypothetical protein B4144_0473 [Bacillus atrophaeus]
MNETCVLFMAQGHPFASVFFAVFFYRMVNKMQRYDCQKGLRMWDCSF